MKAKLYLETTVVSYLTALPTRDVIMSARQQITAAWWAQRVRDFDCVISQIVLDEAAKGDPFAASRRLAVLKPFRSLEINNSVIELASHLIKGGALPTKAVDDAGHIAISAVWGVDFLLTWNFRHIANAEKMERIRDICRLFGFHSPVICTPEELLKGAP